MIKKDRFILETEDPYKKSQYFSQFPATTHPSKHKLIDRNYKRTKEKIWDFYGEGKFKPNNFYEDKEIDNNLKLESICQRQAHMNAKLDRDMQETWGLLTKIRSNLNTGLRKNDELIKKLDNWGDERVAFKARKCVWEAQKNRDFDNLEDFERLQDEIKERRFEDYALLGEAGRDAKRRFLGDNFQEHFLGEGEVYKEFLYKKKIFDDIVNKGDLHYLPHEYLYGKNFEEDNYQRAEILRFVPSKKLNLSENNGRNELIDEPFESSRRNLEERDQIEKDQVSFNFCGFEGETEESERIKNLTYTSKTPLTEEQDSEKPSLKGENMIMYENPIPNPNKKKQRLTSQFNKLRKSTLELNTSRLNTGSFQLQTAIIESPIFNNKESLTNDDGSSINDTEMNEVVKLELNRIQGVEIETIEEEGEKDVTFEIEVARFVESHAEVSQRSKSQISEGFRIIQKTFHIEKNSKKDSESIADKEGEDKESIVDKESEAVKESDNINLVFVKAEPELIAEYNIFKDEKEAYLDEDEIRRKNDKIDVEIFGFRERKSEEGKVKLTPSVDQIVRKMEKSGKFTPKINQFIKKDLNNLPKKLSKREADIAEILALERQKKILEKRILEVEKKNKEDLKRRDEMDRKMATVLPPPERNELFNITVKTQKTEKRILNNEGTNQLEITRKNFMKKKQEDIYFDFSKMDLNKIEPSRHFMSIKSLVNENNPYAMEFMESQSSNFTSKQIKEKIYTEDQLKKFLISQENSEKKSNLREKEEEENPVKIKEVIFEELLRKLQPEIDLEIPSLDDTNSIENEIEDERRRLTFDTNNEIEEGLEEEPFLLKNNTSSRQSNIVKFPMKTPSQAINRSSRLTENSRLFNYTITEDNRRDTLENQSLTFIVDPFEIEDYTTSQMDEDFDMKKRDNVESLIRVENHDEGECRVEEDVIEEEKFTRDTLESCDHDGLMDEICNANEWNCDFN